MSLLPPSPGALPDRYEGAVTTIVLAAGQGSRLGGPKALLQWTTSDGQTAPLALVHARVRLAAESARVLVVVREPVAAALQAALPAGAELVVSSQPEMLGPAGSLAAAAVRLADAALVLVTPVDALPATAATTAALLGRLAEQGSLSAVRPRHGERRGHPVALRRWLLDRYLAPDPPPLRELLSGLGDAVQDVSVDEPVWVDLNTPEDVAAHGPAPLRFLR